LSAVEESPVQAHLADVGTHSARVHSSVHRRNSFIEKSGNDTTEPTDATDTTNATAATKTTTANTIEPEVHDASGELLFTFTLSQWSWCGEKATTCADNEGAHFVDIYLDITSPIAPTLISNETGILVFDEGHGSALRLLREVVVDGEVQMMPEGFPVMTVKEEAEVKVADAAAENATAVTGGEKTRVTSTLIFRLPRFKTEGAYDGSVHLGSGSVTQHSLSLLAFFVLALQQLYFWA